MNERIKLLWEEAAKTTQGDSWEEQTKFMEKYTELVVRECMNVCAEREEDIRTRIKDDGKAAVAYMCRAYIKEHFGVEG